MMKKHLVIVSGIIYPSPSPTGLCSLRYASLLRDEYDIEFIAISPNGKQELVIYEGFPVHTLSSELLSLEYKFSGIMRKLIHLLGSSKLKISIMGNLGWYAKAVYHKLEKIHSDRPINAILTVCSPFPSHMAGAKFKTAHPGVRFIAYTVDPFASTNRIIPFFRRFKDLVELERDVCGKADYLLLSEEAITYRQDVYGDITNKKALPYLLPEVKEMQARIFDKEHIHCVYAGRFYKDIRNPEFMLKVFSALNNKKIVLHLFSVGCEDIVQTYANLSDQIRLHGYVSQNELQLAYASCDFLIGVGNAINDFLPSKTYEYLALRRPVVFFNTKGYENNVLKKYPHSIQISDDYLINDAVGFLENFIVQEQNITISQEELCELYKNNNPTSVREVLVNVLNIKFDE